MVNKNLNLGIDVGSTTVKAVVINQNHEILFSQYSRHMSNIFDKVSELIAGIFEKFPKETMTIAITGSGGLSLSEVLSLPFEQEVIACSKAVETFIPVTDVAIELGGEDAKITFYKPSIEQRMNGSCAGGTGAFMDQMAVLLNTDSQGLNEYAKPAEIIYPIAARCGVFAKTDIQPLINDGARKEDIAASIFQAVVNQTITGLACGRTIKGNVAFLGGPLHFLSELRKRFIVTLGLSEDEVIFPENAQYYVALGAAILSRKFEPIAICELMDRTSNAVHNNLSSTKHLAPLFQNQQEYDDFVNRHKKATVRQKDIQEATGPCFLGVDAGSTTTKAALIDSEGNLLYSFYRNNEGKPLEATGEMLKEMYEQLPQDAFIARSVATGYGEALIVAAYGIDEGEIETMAHFKAAEAFLPGVDFILDIGGQDMKCMMVKDGVIHNIMLNEACSSGCGSFIETYAKSMNLGVNEFASKALFAENPVDLGTRCTVFMNSKVKQSQKEGATVGDISAGLSYSVIKNAMYKVIKLRNPEDAGENIVVQGGTFLNEAVLRSVEKILERDVIRPNLSGVMGAYGAALIAKSQSNATSKSNLILLNDLENFSTKVAPLRCSKCANKCLMTVSYFSDGSKFITGNRCEKGVGNSKESTDQYNLFDYKYKRLFEYVPLAIEDAPRGEIGIPRILNMYENYPFWFTFFTKLGFRVVLSPQSTKKMYEFGMETISSDTVCYPAKLVHGHIKWLINQGVKNIFYPSINYEENEDEKAENHYNCPIVATYPEVIANNMDEILQGANANFIHPFLPFDRKDRLSKRLFEEFSSWDKGMRIEQVEVERAVLAAADADSRFKADIKMKASEITNQMRHHNLKAIILAGRPYHLDPEINHGIDKMIASYGMAVLTEDSVAYLGQSRKIRVLNQWMYHSRLYRAADYATNYDDIELVQLNSFGCGLDAVTVDQIAEILETAGKIHTVIKIDEGGNLGAARIRIRSLKAALEARDKCKETGVVKVRSKKGYRRKEFTEMMRKRHTIIIPQMSPIHFQFLQPALLSEGYHAVILPSVDKKAVDEGLKYINNDACYPTIVALGQIINALKSGEFDLEHTSVMVSQTGGGCRASNYIAMLRKALKDLGMQDIPVISANYTGLERNEGFKITYTLILKIILGMLYGDLLSRLLYKTRPYEKVKGSANELYQQCVKLCQKNAKVGSVSQFKKDVKDVVNAFDHLEINDEIKPKVGIVGEILVKYHPTANNDLVGVIEHEGGEAVVPDIFDFFLYGMYSKAFNYEKLAGSYIFMTLNRLTIKFLEKLRDILRVALEKSERFSAPHTIHHHAEKAKKILSLGNQYGEGWLLTGEMMELMDDGVNNIVCLQPFACLPNHVTGKGMIKALRKYNEKANIVAIDYDPGASEVNQINRLKLMMSTAKSNLEKTAHKLQPEESEKIKENNNESSNYSFRS